MIIYCTTNLINGKKYIGYDTKNNPSYLGSGVHIKFAIKKYGKENFKKEILEKCDNFNDLKQAEIYWVDYFNCQKSDLFYNIAPGGEGGNVLVGRPELIALAKIKRENTLTKNPSITLYKVLRCKETKKLRPFVICPHCNYQSKNKGNMVKCHFDRCKENPALDREAERMKRESFIRKHQKPIIQLTLEGRFLFEFDSIKTAYEKTNAHNIGICLKDKNKTSGGFKWVYKSEYYKEFL